MRTGVYISGIGHLSLIVWILFGGLFLRAHDLPEPVVSNVSMISEAEYAALTAPSESPSASTEAETPEPPSPDANPDAGPAPETLPDTPAMPEPPLAETPAEPEPAAEAPPPPAPLPDPAPAPPQPVAPEPPAPDPGTPEAVKPPDAAPKPKPSPRIAEPAPEAPPETEAAEAPSPEVAPVPEPAPVVEDPKPAAAPPEAAPEIVTEAEKPTFAPETSMRPKARPAKPVQVAAAEPKPAEPKPAAPKPADPKPAAEPKPPKPDAVDAALAEALGGAEGNGGGAETPARPSGPPMTSGEREDFARAVRNCWVVDPGSAAASVVVDVRFELTPAGKVIPESIRMVSNSGGSDAAVRAAFEKARIAIRRGETGCNGPGLTASLPRDKYEQWKEVVITFDPARMRLK